MVVANEDAKSKCAILLSFLTFLHTSFHSSYSELQKEWNCCFLFTGEEPITKATSGGGVKNRVIEVEATEKVIADGNFVSNFVRKNYGFAGKEFINNIPKQEELQQRYREIFKSKPALFNASAYKLLFTKQISSFSTYLPQISPFSFTHSTKAFGVKANYIKFRLEPEKSDLAYEEEYKQQEMEDLPF